MSWKLSSIHPGIYWNILEFHFFIAVRTLNVHIMNNCLFPELTMVEGDETPVLSATDMKIVKQIEVIVSLQCLVS